jgi:cation diffusion facilitator family transporter
MSEHGSSAKAIFYAFIANFFIAVTKAVAAWYTRSGSMLAEAIHSIADCGNQVLLYVGMRQSLRPPDARHPLGYGKLSYFWSFVVAMLLFSLGGLFSIAEGWRKLHEPELLHREWIALLVLGVSIVLETGSLMGCLREIKVLRRDKPFQRWLRETRNAELVVVLGEDIAALFGLAIAFIFVSLAALTGEPRFDAIGSISIGVVLVAISIFVAMRIKHLITGSSAEPELRQAIDAVIRDDPAIEKVFNAITLQFGPKVMLAAKIKLRPDLSIDDAVEHINALERRLKEEFPQIGWSFIEPDVTD